MKIRRREAVLIGIIFSLLLYVIFQKGSEIRNPTPAGQESGGSGGSRLGDSERDPKDHIVRSSRRLVTEELVIKHRTELPDGGTFAFVVNRREGRSHLGLITSEIITHEGSRSVRLLSKSITIPEEASGMTDLAEFSQSGDGKIWEFDQVQSKIRLFSQIKGTDIGVAPSVLAADGKTVTVVVSMMEDYESKVDVKVVLASDGRVSLEFGEIYSLPKE